MSEEDREKVAEESCLSYIKITDQANGKIVSSHLKKNHQFSKQVIGGIQWAGRQTACHRKKILYLAGSDFPKLATQRTGDSTSRLFELDELQTTGPETNLKTTNQGSSLWLPKGAVVGAGGWAAKCDTGSPKSTSPQTSGLPHNMFTMFLFLALPVLLGCLWKAPLREERIFKIWSNVSFNLYLYL